MARILVVDNYDSFVYNLVQYVGELGADPVVRRPGEIDPAGMAGLAPDGLLISPGPGRPEEATTALALLAAAAGRIPVLGVCLGHQCIAVAYGASVVRVPVMHGKTSSIAHDGKGVFAGLSDPLVATRYHSLAVDTRPDGTLALSAGGGVAGGGVAGGLVAGGGVAGLVAGRECELEVTAWATDGTVMGLRHRGLAIEGVQFHPESILTDGGHRLVANWLTACGQAGALEAAGPAAERQRLPA